MTWYNYCTLNRSTGYSNNGYYTCISHKSTIGFNDHKLEHSKEVVVFYASEQHAL